MNQVDARPILVDIGASGTPPALWQGLKLVSTYIGFDPDSREIRPLEDSGFYAAWIVNKAIVEHKEQETVRFYLTRSPYCSSTLHPVSDSLENYLYADLFTIESQKDVPSITLEAALYALNFDQIHWLKLDSQGMDLRLFTSLPASVSQSILALDVEPGLIDAYEGEDLFTDLHTELTKYGFWLADASVLGSVRVNKQSVAHFPHLTEQLAYVKTAPGWVEARYLRTVQSLQDGAYNKADYVMLWVFTMQAGHFGFALDVLSAYVERFGNDSYANIMEQEVTAALRRISPHPLVQFAKSLLPRSLKRWVKIQINRLKS